MLSVADMQCSLKGTAAPDVNIQDKSCNQLFDFVMETDPTGLYSGRMYPHGLFSATLEMKCGPA